MIYYFTQHLACLIKKLTQQHAYCEKAGGVNRPGEQVCWGNPSRFLSWNALALVRSKFSSNPSRKEDLPGLRAWVLLWGCRLGHSNANFSWHWLPCSLWRRSFRCVWEPYYFSGISFTWNTSWAVSNRIGKERES